MRLPGFGLPNIANSIYFIDRKKTINFPLHCLTILFAFV